MPTMLRGILKAIIPRAFEVRPRESKHKPRFVPMTWSEQDDFFSCLKEFIPRSHRPHHQMTCLTRFSISSGIAQTPPCRSPAVVLPGETALLKWLQLDHKNPQSTTTLKSNTNHSVNRSLPLQSASGVPLGFGSSTARFPTLTDQAPCEDYEQGSRLPG